MAVHQRQLTQSSRRIYQFRGTIGTIEVNCMMRKGLQSSRPGTVAGTIGTIGFPTDPIVPLIRGRRDDCKPLQLKDLTSIVPIVPIVPLISGRLDRHTSQRGLATCI